MLPSTNFFFFYIIYISLNYYESYILINLKKVENETEKNAEYSPEIFTNNIFNKYYALLNIGNPPQKTEMQFSLRDFSISMHENICLTSNYYNKNKSLTITQTHDYDIDSKSLKIIIVKESIEFPIYDTSTNALSYKSIPDFAFQYYKYDINETIEVNNLDKDIPGMACLLYGFKFFCEMGSLIREKLFSILKKNELIKTENFHYRFYSQEEKKANGGYDSAIIIGEQPHEYDKNKYKEENYKRTNALDMVFEPGWILEFKNYYYLSNGTKINFRIGAIDDLVKGWFWLDLDIIIGTKDYYNSIKRDYFDKYTEECKAKKISKYNIFWCDKNLDTKNFPTIYFHSLEYNYTFEMTYKELFEIRGDKQYFLIVFDTQSHYPWKLGRIFLQKYFLNFETDSKQIGFYNNYIPKESEESKEKDDNNIWMWIIFGLIIIAVGVGGFFIGNCIKKKNRKKRANELDDEDFEYKQKNFNEKFNILNKEKTENDILGIN